MMAEHIHTFTFTIIYMYIYIISWQYTHIGINSHISLYVYVYIYIHTYVVYSVDPTPTRPPSHSQAVIRERLISHLDLCPLTGRAKTCGTCDLAPTVRRNAKDLPTNGLKIGLKIGFTIYIYISPWCRWRMSTDKTEQHDDVCKMIDRHLFPASKFLDGTM